MDMETKSPHWDRIDELLTTAKKALAQAILLSDQTASTDLQKSTRQAFTAVRESILNNNEAEIDAWTKQPAPQRQESDVILQVTHHGKLQPSDNPALLDDMFIDDIEDESEE